MTAGLSRLKPLTISRTSEPGRLADGGGLYLCIGKSEHRPKTWAFFYFKDRKRRELGLGSLEDVSAQDARALAAALRAAQAKGIDPEHERDRLRAAATPAAPVATFRQLAQEYIASKRNGWKNDRHKDQWAASLEAYSYPIIGDLPVSAVDRDAVLRVLQPIWSIKPETASRVRGRMEAILGYATFKGLRDGANPALWRDGLSHALPPRAKVKRITHYPAMPYAQVPAFMAALAQQPGVAAIALRFAILTAARTGEVIGAHWAEIDEASATWTIPASRMKAGIEHRVALSGAALDIVRALPRSSEYVFPGLQQGKPLSHMAMLDVLRRMQVEGATVHGFRSSFRDWAAEQTSAQHDVVEASLAHATGGTVVRAYLRSDFFEKRRLLMETWGRHCMPEAAEAWNVIRMAG